MFACTLASTDDKNMKFSGNECEKPVITLRKNLIGFIYELLRNGVTDFYVNSEYGIPLWAAEIIIGMKMYNDVRLHIVAPYKGQCQGWPEEWRNKYYRTHEKADSIKFIGCQYSQDCYKKAYEIMADASRCIYVFGYNSEDSYIVGYAEEKGKNVIRVDMDKLLYN